MSEQEGGEVWSSKLSAIVGRRLREVREERGLSAQSLSVLLADLGHEIKRASLSQLERGQRGVSLADLLALSLALEVSPLLLLIDPRVTDPLPLLPGGIQPVWFMKWWTGEVWPLGRGDAGSLDRWLDAMGPLRAWNDWIALDDRIHALWGEIVEAWADTTLRATPEQHRLTLDALESRLLKARKEQDALADEVPWLVARSARHVIDDSLAYMKQQREAQHGDD